MEPAEVLGLIRTASDRFETVRASLRHRADGRVHRQIREGLRHSEAGRRAFRVSPGEAARPVRHPEPDGPFGWRCRAWHADSRYRWRMETEVPGGGVAISACRGSGRPPIGEPPRDGLCWDHRVGAASREHDPAWFSLALDHYWTFYPLLTDSICNISFELGNLDLRMEDTVRWAGREAVRMVGVPGEEWDWGWDPDPLSWGADEYEVVVDAERGILLRSASRLGGEDFDALEVEEIYFDERLREGVFSSREPLAWAQ